MISGYGALTLEKGGAFYNTLAEFSRSFLVAGLSRLLIRQIHRREGLIKQRTRTNGSRAVGAALLLFLGTVIVAVYSGVGFAQGANDHLLTHVNLYLL